ncbi:hypothetical protein F0562_012867 [Nyssa sinensis]|uniref:DUF4408 domain-containing protein n=1 Tax=Nyssa sinensis TaxID=561372 RepID=A0A5J4ZWC8_9ASTE|nr:hypothetical protein F0562_012867 [Nyssa sinensis]
MADTDSYIKPQKLGSQLPPNHANESKFFTRFLFKAFIVTIFLVLLPLFPTQAPEFINQSFHTRSWELLQLLFVGIAVSYGLFSKRNDETEKEHSSTFDNAQSYVNRFLQVSSVFDDEAEIPSGFDYNKVQTWNSQYYRGEPLVLVAQESSVLEEQRGVSFKTGEKPLLLPVRRLKSMVSESDVVDSTNEFSGKSGSLSRSSTNSGSKSFSNNSTKTRNGEFGGSDSFNLEGGEENVVLPSPIPWRSRSGRMEMKEDFDLPLPLPPSVEESGFKQRESRSSRSQTSWSSRPNSMPSSPNKQSPSPSLSPPNNFQDLVRKKNYGKSSPPPAPPPPPPFVHKSVLMKSNSSVTSDEVFAQKELKRSVRSVPKNLNGSSREEASVSRRRTQSDGSSKSEEVGSKSVGDGGPDVNKKAEEFIAKFREQIRLQRIESIKKSTGQIA